MTVSKRQGTKGISSLHYYLMGNDAEGNKYTIEINEDDYTNMGTKDSIIVRYYENTKRLYEFADVK